jgi:succinate dehydrogenase / fumarate reductase cytochrome b subunit
VWGLYALADGRETYDAFISFCGSVFGQILLIGWSAAFFYHMSTGIRHFILDAGFLYEKKNTAISGYAVLLIAATLTVALWGSIYGGLI